MFYSIYNLGGSHRVFEVDGDYQHSGGTAKRVRELGGGCYPYSMILFAFLLSFNGFRDCARNDSQVLLEAFISGLR